jgi:hypothetical protein
MFGSGLDQSDMELISGCRLGEWTGHGDLLIAVCVAFDKVAVGADLALLGLSGRCALAIPLDLGDRKRRQLYLRPLLGGFEEQLTVALCDRAAYSGLETAQLICSVGPALKLLGPSVQRR